MGLSGRIIRIEAPPASLRDWKMGPDVLTRLRSFDGKGMLRFTRLSELVEGVSQKMFTQTVGHMEHDGLIANYDVSAGHSPR
jgi:DNA-binding HxlR family transcriptional regulator